MISVHRSRSPASAALGIGKCDTSAQYAPSSASWTIALNTVLTAIYLGIIALALVTYQLMLLVKQKLYPWEAKV